MLIHHAHFAHLQFISAVLSVDPPVNNVCCNVVGTDELLASVPQSVSQQQSTSHASLLIKPVAVIVLVNSDDVWSHWQLPRLTGTDDTVTDAVDRVEVEVG